MDDVVMDKQITKKRKLTVIQLSDQLQDEFISFVHQRVGILIKREHKELIYAITSACEDYQCSPAEYLDRLREAEDNSDLLSHLVSAITIGETYFFRDKQQIKLLNEVVLPKIIERKQNAGEKTLRIWSAGCSSGEEIYTVVMLLKDLLPEMNDWKCDFLATDINIDVLKKGISGSYGEWSMRAIHDEYLSRYFTKNGTVYQLIEDIKKRVTFEYVNLNSETYPSIMNGTTLQDLIICRNVLIYFDNDHIKSILEKVGKCIIDDGYILLGASDPIAMMNTGLASVHGFPSLFTKKSRITSAAAQEKIWHAATDHDAQFDAERIRISHANLLPRIEVTKRKPEIAPVWPNKEIDEEIKLLLSLEKWSEVIAKCDQFSLTNKMNAGLYVCQATALANMGKTIDAIKACEESIRLDKMNKEAYFIYALSLAELKRMKDAETAYRKALYIDPDFLLCRYQFGLFLIHMKRNQEGVKALLNTIKSASQFDEDNVVPDSQNMRYKDLITVLNNEIALHQ